MASKSCPIEAMVCGYQMYKEVWTATDREEPSCVRDVENYG